MNSLTSKDIKILKYIKNNPCSPSELPLSFGDTSKLRFYNLLNIGLIEPIQTFEKDECGACKTSDVCKISVKGVAYLEDIWSIKIDDLKALIERESVTIITAFITAAATYYALPAIFSLLKSLLMQ